MKALKRIIIWMFISLVMQIGVLYYLDNYLFASEGVNSTIVSKKVDNDEEKPKRDVSVSIPDDAKNLSVSYDGSYLSYYKDDILKVVDISSGRENDVEIEDRLKVSFYKWAPDRNILFISAKKEYNNSCKFVFYSYDAERNSKDKLETKEQDETAFVANKFSEVEDIQLSPLTNMIYIKTALKGGRSTIHSINIMKRINKVNTRVRFIGDITIIPNNDGIAYESRGKNKVYITGKDNPIYIKGVNKLSLIDIDDNDNIYVGDFIETDPNGNHKINNIYYGGIEEDTSDWKKIPLTQSVNKKDIYISRDGKIYLNDNLKGGVTELNSQVQTQYKGVFLQMYDGGIASISEGKLLETSLK